MRKSCIVTTLSATAFLMLTPGGYLRGVHERALLRPSPLAASLGAGPVPDRGNLQSDLCAIDRVEHRRRLCRCEYTASCGRSDRTGDGSGRKRTGRAGTGALPHPADRVRVRL